MIEENLNGQLIKDNINKMISYNTVKGELFLSELKTKYQISNLTLEELENEINDIETYREFINNLSKFVYRNNTYIFFIYEKANDIISFINNNHEKYSQKSLLNKEKYIISRVSETSKKSTSLNADFKSQYELDQKLFLDQPLLFSPSINFESITRHNYANALKIKKINDGNNVEVTCKDLKNDIYFLYTTNLLLKRYPEIYNYNLLNQTKNIIESSSDDAFEDKKDYKFYHRYANKTLKNIEKVRKEIEYNTKIYYKR